MKCPKCSGGLVAWYWQDGGCKGVQCETCEKKWWSDKFSSLASEAAAQAIQRVVDENQLFDDVLSDETVCARDQRRTELWAAARPLQASTRERVFDLAGKESEALLSALLAEWDITGKMAYQILADGRPAVGGNECWLFIWHENAWHEESDLARAIAEREIPNEK